MPATGVRGTIRAPTRGVSGGRAVWHGLRPGLSSLQEARDRRLELVGESTDSPTMTSGAELGSPPTQLVSACNSGSPKNFSNPVADSYSSLTRTNPSPMAN
jgi:hypothetical protein